MFFILIVICIIPYYPLTVSATDENITNQTKIQMSKADLIIDGKLDDDIWQVISFLYLKPAETGVPEKLGGKAGIVIRGSHLCIGIFIPEPDGKVLARSIGYNPIWEKDILSSPELEDRLLCKIRFNTTNNKVSELGLEINPWGAFRVERDGKLVPRTGILTAADITKKGWNVEIAIPLDELNLEKSVERMKINLEQIRSRRPSAPEFHWVLKNSKKYIEFKIPQPINIDRKISTPRFSPPLIGNSEPALKVGYVQLVPPLDTGWDEPFWQSVPGFHLPRNEPNPRKPGYPTEIKWIHDGKTLAIFFRCTEDERVDCDTGVKDGNVGSDDHICIYFSTSGSSLIEVLVNPAGAIRDSKGTGPHMYRISAGSWNGNIQKHCLIVNDAWYVRLNLPLDEIAEGLGELGIPEDWKILIGRVRQSRIGEPREISTIPVIENPYFLAPARYRQLKLTNLNPTKVIVPEPVYLEHKMSGLAGELTELNSDVFSRVQRKYFGVREMMQNSIREKVRTLAMEENKEWNAVKTKEDWEKYRDKRIEVLKASLGKFPETNSPLLYQVTGTHKGDGYQVKNIVYQSRPGFFIAANLYLPEVPSSNMPAIIILPSHHWPKIEGELQDCGMIWARSGCAVLIMEMLGFGERVECLPWYRQAYHSKYIIEMQLDLIGQSRFGWITQDVKRTVDLFYEMDNIDREKIILIGAVTSGGGPSAGVAAIFEKRLAAVIPFNFGRVYWEGWGIRNSLSNKITLWFIYNSAAPKKFIYAHEFWWEGEEGPEYPSVWVPTWPRLKKVYGLYGAEENLTTTQGTGLLRVNETAGDCWNLGPAQRKPIFHVLKKWFDIPLPSEEDQNIEIDSKLSFTKRRPDYPVIKFKESKRRMPDSAFLCITPEVSAALNRIPLHKIAKEMGEKLLKSAREKRAKLDAFSCRQDLKKNLSHILGDIEPDNSPKAEVMWSKKLSGVSVEALTLKSESNIIIPAIIIKPEVSDDSPIPVVIALTEGGKDRFLKNKSKEIERLIKNGIAICFELKSLLVLMYIKTVRASLSRRPRSVFPSSVILGLCL